MNRLIPILTSVLLFGCGGGDPDANDPMLVLNVKRSNSESLGSLGRYRVSHTGVISESRVGPANSAVTTNEIITIDKIADEGVTLTVSLLDSDGGNSRKKFLVPYDKEISVAISKDATATARLERK